MLDDILEIRIIGDLKVYFRINDTLIYRNQALELEEIVKYLTGEKFENYAGKFTRKLKNPENFEILGKYPYDYKYYDYSYDNEKIKFICLCSEDTCNHLVIIRHIPSNIYMAVGSICYLRFSEENNTDIYRHCKAKRCELCQIPLVYIKELKNTDKGNRICYKCDYELEIEKKEFENRLKESIKIKEQELEELKIKEKEIKEKRKEIKERQKELDKQEEQYIKELKNMMINKKVYLDISYNEKDNAKLLGAKWDNENKLWYAPDSSIKYQKLIDKYKK